MYILYMSGSHNGLLSEVAEKRGAPRAQIALAWVLQKDPITSPIIGSTKASHLEDSAASLSIRLSPEAIALWKSRMYRLV
ncbi:aldo/keto reductase [Bacillus sp. OTU530]|uniref:aldo/keto reductase n=1 Tax=Bacillus sp. OTU530 TaxID=3043862 RepID=UPI00406C9DA1